MAIDFDALADSFIRMVGQGSYQAGQRILKKAIEEGRRETPVRKVEKTPRAPKAPTKPVTKRQYAIDLMKTRAAQLYPELTPTQALAKYAGTEEGSVVYQVYDMGVRAGEPPEWAEEEPVEKMGIFHADSPKAKIWREISDRAEALMRERYEAAHARGESALFTREMAISEVALADPSLYARFQAASDEPVER